MIGIIKGLQNIVKKIKRKNKILKDKETYQMISKKERLKGREYTQTIKEIYT